MMRFVLSMLVVRLRALTLVSAILFLFIYDNDSHIEVTDKLDVNVFATAAEAYKWAAKMTMMFDESCIPTKRAYVVRFHAMD